MDTPIKKRISNEEMAKRLSQPLSDAPEIVPEVVDTPEPTKEVLPEIIPLRRKVTVKQKGGKNVLISQHNLDLFLEAYIECDGNGTEAIMKAFPKVTKRANAAAYAHNYLQKAKHMGRAIMEKKGHTMGKLIDKAAIVMDDPKNPNFVAILDRLMKIGGYEDFLSKAPVSKATVNIMNVQKELIDEYTEGTYVNDSEE